MTMHHRWRMAVRGLALCLTLAAPILAGLLPTTASAEVCARVKIQIVQELTLERQAFDAHMKVTNGLTHVSIEDFAVEVLF